MRSKKYRAKLPPCLICRIAGNSAGFMWTARSRFAEIEAGHEPLHWDAIRLLTASIPASSNSRSR